MSKTTHNTKRNRKLKNNKVYALFCAFTFICLRCIEVNNSTSAHNEERLPGRLTSGTVKTVLARREIQVI